MNISSAVVHAKPGAAAAVSAMLKAAAGIEVHAVSDEGKLIITIEADDDGATAATFGAVENMDGVLSVAMVYHQIESDPEMEISLEA